MDYRKYFILGAMVAMLWGWMGSIMPVWGHDPHDVTQQVELSPMFDQDQTVYSLVRGNFLKSVDGGSTWQRQVMGLTHQTPLKAFAIAPTTPQLLYLSTEGNGLYRSTNGGQAWTAVNQGLPDLALGQVAVSPNDDNVVIVAGHEHHLYRSNQGGNDWTLVLNTDGPVTAIATRQDRTLIGTQQGQIFSSPDDGQTWSPLMSAASAITSITFMPGEPSDQFWVSTESHGILKTTDKGRTLTAINQGLPETNIQDMVSSLNPDINQPILYASTANDGVFYLDAQETTWQPAKGGLTTTPQADKHGQPHFTDLAISPNYEQDGILLASGFNGLFKTTSRGESWQQLDTLPGDIVMALALSPDYGNDNTLVVVTYVGEAYISEDGGNQWTPMAKGLELPLFTNTFDPVDANEDPRRFQSLAFSPNYRQDKTLLATILNNGLLRHTPRKGWQLHRFKTWERAVAIAPALGGTNDSILFAGSQEGRIYRSNDGGKTFDRVGDIGRQFGNESPFMVVSPNYTQDRTVFMTGKDGVYKSTDAGKSWQVMTTATQIENRLKLKLAISPNYGEDQTLWLGSTDGLLQTQDGGQTWSAVVNDIYGEHPYIEAVAVSPNYGDDRTVIISIRGQGLWKSTDGGQQFTSVSNTSLPMAIVNNFEYGAMPLVFSPNYQQDQTLYGFGAVTGEIFKSTDGAQTWQTITLPNSPIFKAYSNYQYSLGGQIRCFFSVYKKPLLKFGLASLAGCFCYGMLSGASQFLKILWLRQPMRMGAATMVTGLAIAVLFI
ncbi:MAG: hypothetical protein KTR27_06740 [Leptolyngbyaceae cyanobacterium MAG.088]|nr:hypothetical protein [Leptolyngbyaceae cyanobacterium MAG.088]